MKLSGKITGRVIQHLKSWGDTHRKNYLWTKHDSNLYLLLTTLEKDLLNKKYKNEKQKKVSNKKKKNEKVYD